MLKNLVSEFASMKQTMCQIFGNMADDARENEEHGGISPESYSGDRSDSDPIQDQKGEENNECAILGQCAASLLLSEVQGLSVSNEMSTFVQKLMATSLDESKKAVLVEKHQIPENTTSLNNPKVNPEIWREGVISRNKIKRHKTPKNTI
jgi:hypothetical protein